METKVNYVHGLFNKDWESKLNQNKDLLVKSNY